MVTAGSAVIAIICCAAGGTTSAKGERRGREAMASDDRMLKTTSQRRGRPSTYGSPHATQGTAETASVEAAKATRYDCTIACATPVLATICAAASKWR